MGITYCSRTSCAKVTCDYHPTNAPKGQDVSIADRSNGCYTLASEQDKFYYCFNNDCIKKDCRFHLSNAPEGIAVEATDQDLGCYVGPYNRRKDLLAAICRGTQKTNYKCDDTCKALCGNDGTCAYCSIIADAVEDHINQIRAGRTFV